MLAKSYPQVSGIVRELRRINIVDEVKSFFDDLIKERRDRRGREEYVREQAFADGITKGESKGKADGIAIGKADGITIGESKGKAERERLRQENERLRQEIERLRKNV